MQAVILAAGMGKRLKGLTCDRAKCMIEVNGQSLIERMLLQLDMLHLKQIVIVVGHEAEKLKNYIGDLSIKTPIMFLENMIYYKTNNIYSLYLAKDYILQLAKDYILQDDTLILESDLIFENKVLYKLIEYNYPNATLVANFDKDKLRNFGNS